MSGNGRRCVIISAGPDFWCGAGEIRSTDYVIACDAGYCHAKEAGIVPDLLVGDMDSYRGELPSDVEILRAPAEKDDTDTLLAVKFALGAGFKDFLMLGATGGRLDHQTANFAVAAYIAEQGGSCVLLDRFHRIFTLRNGGITLEKKENTAVSVFSYTNRSEGVTLTGMKYPLTNYTMTNTFPIGVSNEIVDQTARVEVRSGTLLIMLSDLAL